jgi:ribosome maturation factor RimP
VSSHSLRTKVRALIEPVVARLGLDLVAVEWTADGRGQVLRVSVDKPGGIGIDECTAATWRIGPVLDEADPIAAAYRLEVSSPGIERPVERLSDFQRFLGLKVKVRLVEGIDRRRFTGVIGPTEGDVVHFLVGDEDRPVSVEDVERAHLVLTLEEYGSLFGSDVRSEGTDDHE